MYYLVLGFPLIGLLLIAFVLARYRNHGKELGAFRWALWTAGLAIILSGGNLLRVGQDISGRLTATQANARDGANMVAGISFYGVNSLMFLGLIFAWSVVDRSPKFGASVAWLGAGLAGAYALYALTLPAI